MLFTKLELDIMSLAHVPEKDRRLFAVYGGRAAEPDRRQFWPADRRSQEITKYRW